MNEAFIDVILSRYAKKLLQAGQLRKFGYFVENLEFPMGAFLAKEKNKAGKITDYPLALKNLHRDFEFPYPAYDPGSGEWSVRVRNIGRLFGRRSARRKLVRRFGNTSCVPSLSFFVASYRYIGYLCYHKVNSARRCAKESLGSTDRLHSLQTRAPLRANRRLTAQRTASR